MKKYLIPAGLLILALSCGRGEREDKLNVREESAPSEPAPVNEEAAPQADAALADQEEEKAAPESGTYFQNSGAVANNGTSLDIAADGTSASITANTQPSTTRTDAFDRRAISSTAAVTGTDTSHRFIRTADLAFRVQDVVHATLGIEDIVKAHGGWIANTRLRSEPRGMQRIQVSEDSLVELSRYEVLNTISLRVPDEDLDVVLREIGAWVDLFDHRDIVADDIKLRMTANAMAERRARAHSQRLGRAIADRGRKLRETMSAEEALLASDERRDQNLLNNMDLADRVAFSTVSLNIHQPMLTRREMKASDAAITAYQPSLGTRLLDALADGWRLIGILLTGLVSIWPVVALLGASLLLWWRKRRSGRVLPPMVTPQI